MILATLMLAVQILQPCESVLIGYVCKMYQFDVIKANIIAYMNIFDVILSLVKCSEMAIILLGYEYTYCIIS